MVAGIVTTDLVAASGVTAGSFSLCDAITDWLPAASQDVDVFVQGTASNSQKVNNTLTTELFTLNGAINLTNQSIYAWVAGLKLSQWAPKEYNPSISTTASGGIGIRVEDALANYRLWYTGGQDTLPHPGWICHTVNTNQTTSEQSATPANLAAITKIGIRFRTIIASTKINCWWDGVRVGPGTLFITGGTPSSPATFDDFYASGEAITANRWGILDKQKGVYFVQGKLQIGSTAPNSPTYFSDTSQVVIFQDARVAASGYYDISIQSAPTSPTTAKIGQNAGGAGISGYTIKSTGTPKYSFTATHPEISSGFMGIYGTTFSNATTIKFPKATASGEVLNTNFENCLEIYPSGTTMTNDNIINAPTRGLRLELPNFNVTKSSFISNLRAIETPSSGTAAYSFTDLVFTGNTYDIDNTSPSGIVTINLLGTSNAATALNTGGGSVSFLTAASLIINIVDSDGNTITAACEVTVVRNSDITVLYHVEDVTTGTTTYTYTSGGGTVCYIIVHNVVAYQSKTVNNYTLPTSGTTTLTVQLDNDTFYSNPP